MFSLKVHCRKRSWCRQIFSIFLLQMPFPFLLGTTAHLKGTLSNITRSTPWTMVAFTSALESPSLPFRHLSSIIPVSSPSNNFGVTRLYKAQELACLSPPLQPTDNCKLLLLGSRGSWGIIWGVYHRRRGICGNGHFFCSWLTSAEESPSSIGGFVVHPYADTVDGLLKCNGYGDNS